MVWDLGYQGQERRVPGWFLRVRLFGDVELGSVKVGEEGLLCPKNLESPVRVQSWSLRPWNGQRREPLNSQVLGVRRRGSCKWRSEKEEALVPHTRGRREFGSSRLGVGTGEL